MYRTSSAVLVLVLGAARFAATIHAIGDQKGASLAVARDSSTSTVSLSTSTTAISTTEVSTGCHPANGSSLAYLLAWLSYLLGDAISCDWWVAPTFTRQALLLIYQLGKLLVDARTTMEISFATARLQKLCNQDKKLRGEYGPVCAKRIRYRLTELAAASCLEDLRSLPQARCHELTGDRKGQLAVDLEHPKRLIFEPDHDPPPQLAAGGLDWKKVNRVRILEIKDYHKR